MRFKFAAGCLALLFVAGTAGADGSDLLLQKLAEKGVITYGEAQTIMTEGKQEDRSMLAQAKVSTLPGWIQNITMSGDLRLRYQDDWNSAKNFIRVRERVRLRTNFDTRLAESFKAGFGFATGSEAIDATTDELGNATVGAGNVIDANTGSANSTFTGFGRLPLQLNLAFIEYDPSLFGCSLSFTAGKMRQGTQVWNATDLLWESSLNPDGAAFKVTRNITPTMTLGLIGSWLTVNDLNAAVSNPTAAIGEIMYTWDAEVFRIKLGVAQQDLNVANKNTGVYFGDATGVPRIIDSKGVVTANSLDYTVMSESFDLAYKNVIGSNNISLIGDIAANSYTPAVGSLSDTNASCYGVKIGADSVAGFGQWQVVGLSRHLESNSWLNKLGANDPYGAAHNAQGYQGQVNFGFSKAATFVASYYHYDKINGANATTPQDIFQGDLIYKF